MLLLSLYNGGVVVNILMNISFIINDSLLIDSENFIYELLEVHPE